ncbi:hypothetical protein CONCODRAFT_6604 [Conidiobolus coronatus NRRL 28638]|uniref:Uncharacterized protein n=1 Tax=Conidiobolus coronatus (strain ATCC 28846 / CBS 209.66 / NRRL 28638) TaxID=796925 RepID=A0A137P7B8_CONC2|nr:hypothetical protein CONCODRAFT_6604 [Conidiobolus coronatus NRRL 28638]|eukprot:KXN70821.1 hypothetical protein CONCODRAFT_6604 [Conidiobolus coronatus NRRL 28638]
MTTNWLELSQCDSCSKLQQKYQKAYICSNCFNPNPQGSGNCKKRQKLPYYHQLTRKYEHLIDNLNCLIELGVCNNLICDGLYRKVKLVGTRDLGSLNDLETYQFPLILLNINLLKVQTKMEVVLSQNSLIQELILLFENFILPKCTLFLPQKLYKLDRSKDSHNLLLFAILTRSEFLYTPSLELIQALLLIGDLETSAGFSLLQINSVKAITYSQILYLHELNSPIHSNDSKELKTEKILTWLNLIIMEQKSYFYYSSQRLKKVNYLENIKCLDTDTLGLEIKKWVIHVELITKISINMVTAMQLKSIIKSEDSFAESFNLEETLENYLTFIQTKNLGELPNYLFGNSCKKMEFTSYHSAVLFQYIFFHMAKLCILDLFDLILITPKLKSNLSKSLKNRMEISKKSSLISAQKIMSIAVETHQLLPLTSTHLSHLEVSHSVFLWSYFFSFRTLLKLNKIKFNELESISRVMEKLRKFIGLWPTNKNLYDILTLDLEGRGISISYFEINLN